MIANCAAPVEGAAWGPSGASGSCASAAAQCRETAWAPGPRGLRRRRGGGCAIAGRRRRECGSAAGGGAASDGRSVRDPHMRRHRQGGGWDVGRARGREPKAPQAGGAAGAVQRWAGGAAQAIRRLAGLEPAERRWAAGREGAALRAGPAAAVAARPPGFAGEGGAPSGLEIESGRALRPPSSARWGESARRANRRVNSAESAPGRPQGRFARLKTGADRCGCRRGRL